VSLNDTGSNLPCEVPLPSVPRRAKFVVGAARGAANRKARIAKEAQRPSETPSTELPSLSSSAATDRQVYSDVDWIVVYRTGFHDACDGVGRSVTQRLTAEAMRPARSLGVRYRAQGDGYRSRGSPPGLGRHCRGQRLWVGAGR
jgi:hypothetical protein